MNLYPAILTDSSLIVQSQIDQIAEAESQVETIQIDVIDGEFVDNLTVTPSDLIDTNFYNFSVDFHVMTNEPIDYVLECTEIEQSRAIIAQVERMSSQAEYITEVKHFDKLVGLCLDLYTPVSSIDEDSWDKIDIIQLMGIPAGFQKQEIRLPHLLEKLTEVRKIKHEKDLQNLTILVDGGVEIGTLATLEKAGVQGVAVGSALWESSDISLTLQNFGQ